MASSRSVPVSTYRLQLNKDFTFAHAQKLVPYLHSLGISHAYLSPILKAQPGSTHGYDTVDHTVLNPELGTRADFEQLVAVLHDHDMGVLLDYVPNHMGVGGADNWLYLDVLKHGSESRYAEWFDINWTPHDPLLHGKLLVPFLGASYAETLHAGQIVLKGEDDDLAIWAYGEHKLPLKPESARALLDRYGNAAAAMAALNGGEGESATWLALDALIGEQHWRLAHHAVAADAINYRRFFVNSDLAGIRIDRPDVFDHAHKLVFELIDQRLVDGLRIDHVDGLLDPKGYLATLQAKTPKPIYLVVEKILAPHEQIRTDWPVDGTTGYEFGAQLTRLLMNGDAEPALTQVYEDFVGEAVDPPEEAYRCKLRVMDNELAAELFALGSRFAAIARSRVQTADLPENSLRKGLREIIGWLTVYRTYFDADAPNPIDQREIRYAVGKARVAQPTFQPAIFDFLQDALLGDLGAEYDPALVQEAMGKFQQYTGPAMAKGLEDTALYRYNRLVALNEVGAHPEHWSIGSDAFHDANARRHKHFPHCMLTTSTHDTKRGEDTRARIAAIADAPQVWVEAVRRWKDWFATTAPEVDAAEIYLLLQLLLGGWPDADTFDPQAGAAAGLAERLKAAMEKSLREARLRSDWGVPNTEYEDKVKALVDRLLGDAAFLEEFGVVWSALTPIGRRKGLIQAALKLTVLGVPDTYRGAEDWEQSYVDPDNRRDVTFERMAERVAGLSDAVPLGNSKLDLTARLLRLRKALPAVFLEGDYQALDTVDGILRFAREHDGKSVIVLADLKPGHEGKMDQALELPDGVFVDALDGARYQGSAPRLSAMERYGVSVLVSQ